MFMKDLLGENDCMRLRNHACNYEEVSSKSKRWPEAIEKSNIVYPRGSVAVAVAVRGPSRSDFLDRGFAVRGRHRGRKF